MEIEVPHPALLYKKAMEWKGKKKGTEPVPLVPPTTLAEFDINSFGDINDDNSDNVTEAAAYYGVNVEWPILSKIKTFSLAYNGLGYKNDTSNTEVHSESIDENYSCYQIVGSFNVNYKGNRLKGQRVVSYFHFGNNIIGAEDYYAKGTKDEDRVFAFTKAIDPNIVNSFSCFFRYQKVGSLSGSFSLYLQLDAAIKDNWQKEVYSEMQQAYNKLKAQYDEELQLQQAALQAEADQGNNEDYSNPAINRLIEERELKRSCIEMMSKPYCYDMGLSFNNCKTHTCSSSCFEEEMEANVPEIIQNQALENYAGFIKFFETAFQWEIFSYIFYPYYYNEKCRWYELLQTKNSDPIFEAFLQSGMAKILVPIRPQFEKAVLWYLETGEISPECDVVPETADDRYESLLKDLGDQDEVTVEGKWKTRIPSALTIIQAESAYFKDQKGLPCCDDEKSSFGSDDRVLEEKDDKPKEEE